MKLLQRAKKALSHWIPPPLSRFGEYRAIDDDFDVPQMKHTLRWAREIYVEKGWLDSFTDYQALIAAIRELPDSEVVPMRELMRTPAGNVRRLALRYDIDVDPYTALRLARYNARYALCGSFYLLHSSYYYGVFAEGVLHRNPLLREWATALSVAGCELGLHTDPLALYFEHGVDGADGVRQELAWLRSQGVPIEGTVAHNSLPLYGAENFEIFRNRALWRRTRLQWKELHVPLGILDEASLGLTYEGNFPMPVSRWPTRAARRWLQAPLAEGVREEPWMRHYLGDTCYRRAYEAMVWHHGGGHWTLRARLPQGGSRWHWRISLPEMIAALGQLPAGTRTVIVMHPVYFSADADEPSD